jgi:hypothetical protein
VNSVSSLRLSELIVARSGDSHLVPITSLVCGRFLISKSELRCRRRKKWVRIAATRSPQKEHNGKFSQRVLAHERINV